MLAMGTDLGSGAGTFSDIQDFPYVAGNTPTSSANEMAGLMGLTLVPQGNDVELSKLQVVNGDVSYYLTLSSGPSGTNHTLAQHVRSWTPQMWIDSEKEIVDSGLKRAVLGDGSCRWTPKLLYGKAADEIDAKKLRFLPMCLKPITAKARRFSARP